MVFPRGRNSDGWFDEADKYNTGKVRASVVDRVVLHS